MSAPVGDKHDPASGNAPIKCSKCGHDWTPKAGEPLKCPDCGQPGEPPSKKKGLLKALRQFNDDANDGFV